MSARHAIITVAVVAAGCGSVASSGGHDGFCQAVDPLVATLDEAVTHPELAGTAAGFVDRADTPTAQMDEDEDTVERALRNIGTGGRPGPAAYHAASRYDRDVTDECS